MEETLTYEVAESLSARFKDGTSIVTKRRVVAAVPEADLVEFGVLQRGFYYRATVPLQLEGVNAAPCRYRAYAMMKKSKVIGADTGSSHNGKSAGADGASTVLTGRAECAKVTCKDGAVGKAMAGVPRTLDIEVAALTPGMFEARVIIESEGGETRFTVRGHVLDGSSYRAFARTKLQLTERELNRNGIRKAGRLEAQFAAQNTRHHHGGSITVADMSDDGSLLSRVSSPPPPPTPQPPAEPDDEEDSHEDEGERKETEPPPAPPVDPGVADIVDKLLSEEELAEIAEFPTLPGMYYDRESQKMVMAPALRDNWFVDTRMTLLQIEHRTNVKRDQELRKLERKGQVTERVIDAVKQRAASGEGAMGLRSSVADAKPTEGSGQEPADPAMDPAVMPAVSHS
jgi:hypothetical protein